MLKVDGIIFWMSLVERKRRGRTRFAFEKRGGPFLVPEGAFESAMVVKEVFSDETLGVSDTTFWEQFEKKVTMTPEAACFQYYLAGTGHKSLAYRLLNKFENFRAATRSGDLSREEADEKIGRLASKLYDCYPPRYKREIKR